MREIKFRAWDNTEGGMVNGGIGVSLNDIADFDGYRNPNGIGNNELIWEQFTGLKDKNGHDIYEGDKVRASFYPWGSWEGDIEGTVTFDNGAFGVKMDGEIQPLSRFEDIEVIGNIHA